MNYDEAAKILKENLINILKEVKTYDPDTRIQNRIDKYETMGRWLDE